MRRIAALVCLAAGLALLLTQELVTPEPDGADAAASTAVSRDAAANDPAETAASGKPRVLAFDQSGLANIVTSILERPLFVSGRRPPAGPAAAPVGIAPSDAMPRLTGVIVGPNGGTAIFAGADGKSHVAAEGDTMGAFQVRSIGPGLVVLVGPDGPRELRPAYVQASAGSAPPATDAEKATDNGAVILRDNNAAAALRDKFPAMFQGSRR